MFSIVIPLYNKELSVLNTVQSVLNQSIKSFEILIVNDGSTDNSLEIVKKIDDSRIRIIDKSNGGVSSARNRGIEEAHYEWVAFLDADDLWEVGHLEEVSRMISLYPDEKLFATSFRYSDNRSVNKLKREGDVFLVHNYFRDVLTEYLVWTSIFVVKRVVLLESGMFKVNLSRGEDLELWERLAKNNNIVKSKKITATYRIDAENRSDKSLILEKSRIYYFDFEKAKCSDEILYYKYYTIRVLRGLLRKRDFKNFFKLKSRHNSNVKYIDIIKKVK